MKKIALFFTNYGSYHLARLEACHHLFQQLGWEVIGIELARKDNIYDINLKSCRTDTR